MNPPTTTSESGRRYSRATGFVDESRILGRSGTIWRPFRDVATTPTYRGVTASVPMRSTPSAAYWVKLIVWDAGNGLLRAERRLDELASLASGWNGPESEPPTPAVLTEARHALD